MPKRVVSRSGSPLKESGSPLKESVEDTQDGAGQSSKSVRLSHMKRLKDMKDGDEHFNVGVTSVAPINDMYIKIKMASIFAPVVSLNIPLAN